jgi:hypothetical protein
MFQLRLFGCAAVPLGLVVLFVHGCNTDHTITLSDYNTSCVVASDCMGISVGDVCDACCPSGSINVSDGSKYQADFASRRQGCPKVDPDCFCTAVPECVAGQCALVVPGADAGTD